jgi:23S rRNA pseudouridine1911/1915/1917 synthase
VEGDATGETRQEVLEVGPDEEDRIDRFVSARLELSRTRVQRMIAEGRVQVDGQVAAKSVRVEGGSRITVDVPPPADVEIVGEDIPLEIVYEDESLLVVHKAAGMVVHPAPGHHSGTMVNALLHHIRDLSGVGGRLRPGIVHRLDRDTSGLLVVAKNDAAHLGLGDALRQRKVERRYRAACWGHLKESQMTVDAPIARDPRNRKRMAVVEGGRRAVTNIRVLERWLRADFLDIVLETGRTHQIRVHLAHLGHPVVGDDLYGSGWERGLGGPERAWAREMARRASRQFLHAAELAFDHPVTGARMKFEAPLPDDLDVMAEWARS